ncbi:phytanoyl-CoA dioxygenase family protein [Wenxinia marina]|nr:phytanoyl-CoA dioxygenase family protein [Wenxinia marina]
MTTTPNGGPSAADINRFIETGALRVENAFDPALAAEVRGIALREAGPANGVPVLRLGMLTAPPAVAAANTPRLHAHYDALAGAGRWVRPGAMGTFVLRYPSDEAPADTGWHVDVSFGDSPDFMDWRANVTSRGRLLLMLFLFSDVGEEGGPTRIRLGSHRQIARELLPFGEAGMSLRDLAADGFASTADCSRALATGPAGTVWLCHPFLVHAGQPNRGTGVRVLAQPPLLPVAPFDPALPPSPVQRAIRRACGLP